MRDSQRFLPVAFGGETRAVFPFGASLSSERSMTFMAFRVRHSEFIRLSRGVMPTGQAQDGKMQASTIARSYRKYWCDHCPLKERAMEGRRQQR
jgi:hypothetical protein